MANDKKKAITKSQIFQEVATSTGLSRKQVGAVFDSVTELIKREMGKKGPGIFQIPGLVKLQLVKKPATKARPGVNPFTGEKIMIKAKPARNIVRARPLKGLKDMVN